MHRLLQKILHFQRKIKEFQAWHEIPEDLIINFAQTSLPYDFTGKRTCHIQGTSRKRKKKQITGTFSITISGEFLPMQLIYHRTTDHYSLEGVEITVTYTANRWSDDSKAIQYLQMVLFTYVEKRKVEFKLPEDQKAMLIFERPKFSKAKSPINLQFLLKRIIA